MSAKPTGNPTAPHKVVIWLRAEVREVMPTGEVHGNVAHEHPARGGDRFEMFTFEAQDRDIAIRKLHEFMQELRQK